LNGYEELQTPMSKLLPQPWMQKTIRNVIAYGLFAVFALMGVAITFCVRSVIYGLCVALAVSWQVTYLIFVWGLFIMFVPYIFLIGLLDFHLLNEAVATGTLRQRALKILAIEGGIGLVSLVLMGVLALMGYPPAF
jgi:small-conductance mechanosensitive channel